MSWQLRIMGAVMRPVLRRVSASARSPEAIRSQLKRVARTIFRTPPGLVVLKTTYAKRAALWVSSGPVSDARVLLYIHGGGYIAGDPIVYKRLIGQLARITHMRAFVPSYRLAPEHPIPAALEDARAAWAHLVDLGYTPKNIILGGDSAGGGIALALLAELCAKDTSPAGLFAWSPFTDQTFSGASMTENAKRDHFFSPERAPELSAMILGETPNDAPSASPLLAEFPSCPPVLLQVSDSEVLRDDAVRMDARLREFGADSRLEMWKDAPHVWHLLNGWLPEAREAIENTANWINSLPHR